jgi:PmbA protein
MIPITLLKTAVRKALQQLARMKDVKEAEVFASSTDQLLCRLNYTSEIPCHGVEEPKSTESFGLGIRAVFSNGNGAGDGVSRVGFGTEARDFSGEGIRRAIEKARQNAVADPDFVSLPGPESAGSHGSGRRLVDYHDPAIMALNDTRLVEAGWLLVNEALRTFEGSDELKALPRPAAASHADTKTKARPVTKKTTAQSAQRGRRVAPPGLASQGLASQGLILGGDVTIVRQRIAVASSRLPKVQTDESTYLTSLVTGMVERHQAKGTGYAASTHLAKFKGEPGPEAAHHAIQATGGQRLPTGLYTVVLGPQPVSDLIVNLLLPSLTTEAFYSCRSAFLGELGYPVASDILSLYDHGAVRGAVGSKAVTCEGLPTGRTDLIREGVLGGLLSNHYETQRLLRDPGAREKLGINPQEHLDALTPRNGFRCSSRGARQFDALPSIAATNVFLEGSVPHSTESLLQLVGNGVYIGRIWYTYPMNGLRAGDFTCTVVADSYVIRNGRLGPALQGNTIRITGNIRQILQNVLGITKQTRPVLVWGSDEVVYAPEMAVRELQLSEIAQFMESV